MASNRLTLTKLGSVDKKKNQNKKIYVTEERFEVKVCTYFRESMMEDVVTEYVALVEELRTRSELDDVLIRGTLGLYATLVVKKFTDIPFPKKVGLDDLIKYSRLLLDNGITDEVMKSFPKEELDKLEERFKAAQQNAAKMIAEMAVASVAQAQEISDAS